MSGGTEAHSRYDSGDEHDGVLCLQTPRAQRVADAKFAPVVVELPRLWDAAREPPPLGLHAREVEVELGESEVVFAEEESELGGEVREIGGLYEDDAEEGADCQGIYYMWADWFAVRVVRQESRDARRMPRENKNRRVVKIL